MSDSTVGCARWARPGRRPWRCAPLALLVCAPFLTVGGCHHDEDDDETRPSAPSAAEQHSPPPQVPVTNGENVENVANAANATVATVAKAAPEKARAVPASAPPGETPPGPTWNVWWEQGPTTPQSPKAFLAQDALKPNTAYTLVVDLSRARYAVADLSARGAAGAPRKGKDSESRVGLRAVVLPDPEYFAKVQSGRVQDLAVPITSFDKHAPPVVKGESLSELVAAGSLASVRFSLKTKGTPGVASVAVAIWRDDMPLDEVVVPACISATGPEACKGADVEPIAARPAALLEPGDLAKFSGGPDVALQLLEPKRDGHLLGVLRRKGWERGKYVAWPLSRSARALEGLLRQTFMSAVDAAARSGEEEIDASGLRITDLLFDGKDDDTRNAKREILHLFDEHMEEHPKLEASPPALHVRLVPFGGPPVLGVPFGALAFGHQSRDELLGFHFRVSSALPAQSLKGGGACVKRWVFALPAGADDELVATWQMIGEGWPWRQLQPRFADLTKLKTWLAGPEAEDQPAIVVLLGHQTASGLWFDREKKAGIAAGDVGRAFKVPSAVVLDGVKSASVASDLLRRFSQQGMAAAITTNAAVPPHVAGTFLNCLVDAMPKEGSLSMGEAYFGAVTCLRRARVPGAGETTYGARSLTYALLGNAAVPLCAPDVPQQ